MCGWHVHMQITCEQCPDATCRENHQYRLSHKSFTWSWNETTQHSCDKFHSITSSCHSRKIVQAHADQEECCRWCVDDMCACTDDVWTTCACGRCARVDDVRMTPCVVLHKTRQLRQVFAWVLAINLTGNNNCSGKSNKKYLPGSWLLIWLVKLKVW